jgi:heterotetrameric sarcosine oxidase delta subunit
MWIECPYCGRRDVSEFTYGGEHRGEPVADPQREFERVTLRNNVAGPQRERWHHSSGCRTWLTLTRNTLTNEIDADTAL